jgi:hypothetical protein
MLLIPSMPIDSNPVAVPLQEQVVTHNSWWRPKQSLGRRPYEAAQRGTWESYCAELDRLWNEFRLNGYTPEGWQEYQASAEQAKRRYFVTEIEPTLHA